MSLGRGGEIGGRAADRNGAFQSFSGPDRSLTVHGFRRECGAIVWTPTNQRRLEAIPFFKVEGGYPTHVQHYPSVADAGSNKYFESAFECGSDSARFQ